MRYADFGVAIAIGLVSLPVRGDRIDDLARTLRSDADDKVRLSAALNLGRLSDRRAVPAFVAALHDSEPTVRGVAVVALGKLVDAKVPADERARVLAALSSTVQDEPDVQVRAQAQKSLDLVQNLDERSGIRGVYVEIGAMADKTQRSGALLAVMREQVAASLTRRPGFQTRWPSGRPPSESELKKASATGFYIDASIVRLEVAEAHVACAVSMVLATYPQKSLFGFSEGAADVDAASSSARAVAQATSDCIFAVLDNLVDTKIVPTIQSRLP